MMMDTDRHIARALCFATRRMHGFPGWWRIEGWLAHHEDAVRRCPTTRIRTVNGHRMEVNPNDLDGRALYMFGRLEPAGTGLFKALLRPGDGALDIGANIGYYSVLAASLVGRQGRVDAFEPNPKTAEALRRNVALNGLVNVDIHEAAAADMPGELTFHCGPADHSGCSSLRCSIPDASASIRVPAITIDALGWTGPPVRLVKIDAEGAEWLVLNGMRGLLERDRPYIMAELVDGWLRKLGGSIAEVLTLLEGLDYRVLNIDGGRMRPIEAPLPDEMNILAVGPGCAVPPKPLRKGR